MLNTVTVMGRLTRDPEMRYAGSQNIPVASFSVAVDRDYKGSDGERQTDFFECVAWRSTAEFVEKYFAKGRMAVIDGRLQSRKWEDKDGNKRTTVEIVVDNMYFGDSKKEDREPAKREQSAEPKNEPPKRPVLIEMDEDDGELPFE